MSLIKSLIQRLLDSRTTPEEAGHSAMPSSAPTTISSPTSITSWGTITTFTAPDDGYVTFRGRSMVGSTAQIASLPLENNPTIITATQDNYQGMSCNLPVVKGKTIEVYGSNIENIDVYFNRLIGGGYSILLWRALSCLRPSFNYLPRNSLLAGAIGFLISPILHRLPFISRRIKQASGIFSFRRVTAGFVLRPLPHKFCLVTGNFGKVLHRQLPLIGAFQFQFQKAGRWHTYYQKTQQTRLSSLFQASAIRVNALAGGASC